MNTNLDWKVNDRSCFRIPCSNQTSPDHSNHTHAQGDKIVTVYSYNALAYIIHGEEVVNQSVVLLTL